jgi:hypothetical protein
MQGGFWKDARKMGRPGFHGKDCEKKAAEDKIHGGKADNEPDSKFPKKELKKGETHEKEHTDDPSIAKEIAKDHIKEDKSYYEKLDKMEKKD